MYETTLQRNNFDALAGPGVFDPGAVFCVHFSADGRDHGMWFLDDEPHAESGAWKDFDTTWRQGPSGVRTAEVSRNGETLCDAVLLLPFADGDEPGSAPRRDRDRLRAAGLRSGPAALLAAMRQRPLLATFARRVELPGATARQVHRALVSAFRDAPPRGQRVRLVALSA